MQNSVCIEPTFLTYMEFPQKKIQLYNMLFFTIQFFVFCIKKCIKYTHFYHTLHLTGASERSVSDVIWGREERESVRALERETERERERERENGHWTPLTQTPSGAPPLDFGDFSGTLPHDRIKYAVEGKKTRSLLKFWGLKCCFADLFRCISEG